MEDIIKKIKNLMDLANNNPNQHEALAAALKAQELMAKYNVHIEAVDEQAKSMEKRTYYNSSHPGNTKWRGKLAMIVSRNFRCKYYYTYGGIVFFGYKDDVEIALDVFTMLVSVGIKLARKEYYDRRKNNQNTHGVTNTFLMGFCDGVSDALDKQCTALLIVVPKEVEKEYAIITAGFRRKNVNIGVAEDSDVRDRGRIAGRNAVESRRITTA